jgi:hypothetical protein
MAHQGINCNRAHAAPVLIQHRIQFAIWFHDCDYAWLRRVTRSAFSEQGGLSLYRQQQFCASHKLSRARSRRIAQHFRFAALFRSTNLGKFEHGSSLRVLVERSFASAKFRDAPKPVGFAQKMRCAPFGRCRIQQRREHGHHRSPFESGRSPFESGQCHAAPEGPGIHIGATCGMSR